MQEGLEAAVAEERARAEAAQAASGPVVRVG